MMESSYAEDIIKDLARVIFEHASSNLETEYKVRGIFPTRAGVIVLLMDGLLKQLMQWINDIFRHKQLSQSLVTFIDM